MSLDTYLAGSLVGTTRIRLRANGDQGIAMASAADGTSAEAGIVFDDPDSTMSVTGWQPCYVVETLCTAAPRLFTGYVTGRTYRRGHYRTGGGREIDTTIFDSNVLLQMHRINGSDSNRPAETDTQRLAWLLGSGYIPLVSDLGLVDPADRPFDATQYKGQFPSDVLNDLCATRGQIFFVYWDQSAQALGLFFDTPASTAHTSTLTISNVLSDVNDTTCFAPYLDDESTLDPSEVYSNIRYVYKGGVVYRTNATTAATFFPSPLLHRDTQVENDRIGSSATAISFADRILARDAVENQSITMTVKLPAAKVGLIDAGMRLSVRLSHVPGFTSFAYTRVEQKTVTQTEGTPDFYDVGLRLSTFGIVGGGGTGSGSTLPFPISSTTPPSVVQVVFAQQSPTFLVAPTDGNLLLMWAVNRGAGDPGLPAGWTSLGTSHMDAGAGPEHDGRLYWKIAAGDSVTPVNFGTLNISGTLMEFAGAVAGSAVQQSDLNSTVFTSGGAITAPANSTIIGCAQVFAFFGGTITPGAGVTVLSDNAFAGGVAPINWVGQKTATSAGSITVGGTINPDAPGRSEYGGVTCILLSAVDASPTLPGGPVINEFIANGDGTTVLFTTAQSYAPLSLHVRVDGVPIILGLTETDPIAGTFTLDFAPLGAIGDSPAETVYVDYVVVA